MQQYSSICSFLAICFTYAVVFFFQNANTKWKHKMHKIKQQFQYRIMKCTHT